MRDETTEPSFPPVRRFKRDDAASTALMSEPAVHAQIQSRSAVECSGTVPVTDERSVTMTAQVIPFPRTERSHVKSPDDALAALLKAAHARDAAAYKAAAHELAQMADKGDPVPFAFTVAQRFTEAVEDAAHPARED